MNPCVTGMWREAIINLDRPSKPKPRDYLFKEGFYHITDPFWYGREGLHLHSYDICALQESVCILTDMWVKSIWQYLGEVLSLSTNSGIGGG